MTDKRLTPEITPEEYEASDRGWLEFSHSDSDCDAIHRALVRTFAQLDAVRAELKEWTDVEAGDP